MGNHRILSGSVPMEASSALLLKHRIMPPCQTLANLKYSAIASGKEQELVCCYQEGCCCCFLTSEKHKKKVYGQTHLMGSCSMSEDSSYRGPFEFIFGGSQDDSDDGEEEAASVESSLSSLSSESELNSSSSYLCSRPSPMYKLRDGFSLVVEELVKWFEGCRRSLSGLFLSLNNVI
ncbi:hypothetical protein MUK42_18307 [Musa troglodytarum]|uniref:Uncharacterized protein n=1 Tax=Musa troglodytarum TaxID=320322 RepID=A0A9E7HH75_9LILI|nr:hypothetical protein MUK42_18307 [Musa troglodytarum]